MSSGRLLHSFKTSDPTSGDSVVMSSLEVYELEHPTTALCLILGVSSTDKSIRIHEYDSGAMLTREYGQNAVSAIKLLRRYVEDESPRDYLVSCGLDGTIMTWVLSCNSPESSGFHNTPNVGESASVSIKPSSQPLRRVLGKAELSDLQKCMAGEGDTVTPIRGSSASCAQRKTSKYTLAAAPKISGPGLPYPAGTSLSPANARIQRRLSQGHSPTPSQKVTLKSRYEPPSVDTGRQSKSVANLDDLNGLAEQICISLNNFRTRITSSSVAKLEHSTLTRLAKDLNLTSHALDEYTSSKYLGGEAARGVDILDVYLAKMIDERLAIKAKSEEKTLVDGPQSETNVVKELIEPNAIGKEGALSLA